MKSRLLLLSLVISVVLFITSCGPSVNIVNKQISFSGERVELTKD